MIIKKNWWYRILSKKFDEKITVLEISAHSYGVKNWWVLSKNIQLFYPDIFSYDKELRMTCKICDKKMFIWLGQWKNEDNILLWKLGSPRSI